MSISHKAGNCPNIKDRVHAVPVTCMMDRDNAMALAAAAGRAHTCRLHGLYSTCSGSLVLCARRQPKQQRRFSSLVVVPRADIVGKVVMPPLRE